MCKSLVARKCDIRSSQAVTPRKFKQWRLSWRWGPVEVPTPFAFAILADGFEENVQVKCIKFMSIPELCHGVMDFSIVYSTDGFHRFVGVRPFTFKIIKA